MLYINCLMDDSHGQMIMMINEYYKRGVTLENENYGQFSKHIFGNIIKSNKVTENFK